MTEDTQMQSLDCSVLESRLTAESDSSQADTDQHHTGSSEEQQDAGKAHGDWSNSLSDRSERDCDTDEELIAKIARLRSVIGMGVDEQALAELLDAAGGEVSVALECFFEEEKCTNSLTAKKSTARKNVGLRKPFEDIAQLLGNGVEGELLAPLLVAHGGDIETAVEVYFERKEEHQATAHERAAQRRERVESYYRRPDADGEPVKCNIYDLCFTDDKGGKRSKPNSGLPGVGLGVYHSGIEVYGKEISFGYAAGAVSGVFEIPPKCASGVMPNLTFKESVHLGVLYRSRFEVDHVLQRLAAKYRGDTYDIVRKNCNHFSSELAQYLIGSKIPAYVNRPANVGRGVLNVFAVPALALGKLVEGVRRVHRVKEAKEQSRDEAQTKPRHNRGALSPEAKATTSGGNPAQSQPLVLTPTGPGAAKNAPVSARLEGREESEEGGRGLVNGGRRLTAEDGEGEFVL